MIYGPLYLLLNSQVEHLELQVDKLKENTLLEENKSWSVVCNVLLCPFTFYLCLFRVGREAKFDQ